MTKLLFANPQFQPGLNITVRRGVKWAMEKRVTLADLNGNEYGDEDIEARVFRFCDLKDFDVRMEHDEDCRTIGGLFRAMRALYPSFDTREMVTVVSFRYGGVAQ